MCQQLPGCAISRYFIFSNFAAGNTSIAILYFWCCFAVSTVAVAACCCCVAVHIKATHQVQPLRLRPQPKPNSSRFNRSAMSDPKRQLSHPNQIKNPIDHMRTGTCGQKCCYHWVRFMAVLDPIVWLSLLLAFKFVVQDTILSVPGEEWELTAHVRDTITVSDVLPDRLKCS